MNENLKRSMCYLSYGIFLLIVLFLSGTVKGYLKIGAMRDFIPWMFVVKPAIPMAAGMILGLPQLVIRAKQAGKWRIDWVLLLAAAFPALLLAAVPILIYSPAIGAFLFHVSASFGMSLVGLAARLYPFETVGLIGGYVLLRSLVKEEPSAAVNNRG